MEIDFPRFHPSVDPANPPNYKALLIGINYSSSEEDEEDDIGSEDDRPSPLVGPVNDVKEMKKMLMQLYGYHEDDVFTMTDEKENKGTNRWPSKSNIFEAMDIFVRDSSSRDKLVFYYAGHCGRDENDGTHGCSYIITCDNKKIFGTDVRDHLVSPLPKDCRLTAILDACYSAMLLNLEHYTCHCFIRKRSQSVFNRTKNPLALQKQARRRHTAEEVQPRPWSNTSRARVMFKRAAMATRAAVRLRILAANSTNSGRVVAPRPRCGSAFCAYELLNSPLVISVSACATNERTFEDTKRNGRGMTVKLIKILRKYPSIRVGELNRLLNRFLSKMAFKRVWKAKTIFKTLGERLSDHKRNKLEKKYTDQGIFAFRSQTAQFGSLYPLRLDDQFIIKRIVQMPSSPVLQTGYLGARFPMVASILLIMDRVRSTLSTVYLRVVQCFSLSF